MFTPIEAALGALLLHQSTTNYLFDNGKILGCSGLLRQSLQQPRSALDSTALPALLGMASSVPLLGLFAPSMLPTYPPWTWSAAAAASTMALGAVTGWGTKAGCGCTSGHMLIGLSRLSHRSLAAVATFFPTALITSFFAWRAALPACGRQPCYIPSYPTMSTTLGLGGLLIFSQILSSFVFPRYAYSRVSKDQARKAVAALSGLQFGLGLLISGMASPVKVLRFFAFAFDWTRFDPSLIMVILFGILPNLYRFQTRDYNKPPTFADRWNLPERGLENVNGRFILGCMAFGVSWGVSGVCPGPGILRAVGQPVWGALWALGFWLGSLY